MKKHSILTYPIAKINLGLNVVEKRPDGYHNLQTVFYPLNLVDILEIQEVEAKPNARKDCYLKVDNMTGDPEQNLTVRAYRLLKKDFPCLPPVRILLHKGIPMQAGLGGGSSDAACTINLLNSLFDLRLNTKKQIQYASQLGADCAFFVRFQPCYAEGIGDKMRLINLSLTKWRICVVWPGIPVSTKEAFSLIHPHYPKVCPKDAVKRPIETWRDTLVNDFEESVFALHPELAAIKDRLYQLGAVYASMSGSGSALYGIFKELPKNFSEHFPGMFAYCAF